MAEPVATLRAQLGLDSAAFERGARRASDSMGGLRAGAARTEQQVSRSFGGVQQSFARTGRSARAMRSVVQQAGFQLQDIAVQLQAGTRASIVAGQQLPQLLGALGAGGALAGVAITGLSVAFAPLIDNLFQTTSSSQELENNVEALETAMQELADANERAAQTYPELVNQYGEFASVVRGIFSDLAGSQLANAQSRLDDLIGTISRFGEFRSEDNRLLSALPQFFDIQPDAFVFTRAAREAREELEGFIEELETSQAALISTEGDPRAQLQALQEFLSVASEAADRSGERTEQEREFLQLIEQQIAAAARLSAEQNNSVSIALAVRQALAETARIRGADEDAAQSLLQNLQEQAFVQRAIQEFGQGSVQAAQAAALVERQGLEARLDALQASEETETAILAAFDAANNLSGVTFDNIFSAANESARLAGNLAGAVAALDAFSEARRVASGIGGGSGRSAGPGGQLIGSGGPGRAFEVTSEIEEAYRNFNRPARSGGGGGGRGVAQQTAAMQAAEAAIRAAERAALDFSEVQAVLDHRLQNGAISAEVYDAAIEQLTEQFASGGDLQAGISTVADLIGNMAVDFDNAADIALQAVRRLSQGLISSGIEQYLSRSSGGGILGTILGGFSFGGFRANGGPVAAGRSYIVGERGPELFTPGVSGGITPNGAGANVTVIVENNAPNTEARRESSMDTDGRRVERIIIGTVNQASRRGQLTNVRPGVAAR